MAKRWRRLTLNEIEMARLVFSDGIDYERVKIYQGIPYLPNINTAISPNGHIYFPRNNCPQDFTCQSSNYQLWLIHELTHVWQYQQGFQTWWGGILLALVGGYFYRKAYIYPPLQKIQRFNELNMEQQADLIAHYYAAHYLPLNCHTKNQHNFQTALKSFLENPNQKTLLPKYRKLGIWFKK